MKNEKEEQTLVLIKPDALKNSLTGYVLVQLSEFHTGLRFAGAKIVQVGKILAEEHYAEHRGKVFYPSLIDYIRGNIHYPTEPGKRKVKAFVFQGPNAVKVIREICGPTNPHEARDKNPGCIRALGTVVSLFDESGKAIGQRMDNLIHASANLNDAEREIKLWFKPSDIPPAMHIYPTEVNKEFYYFLNGNLLKNNVSGSICILAPGDIAWKTDLDALKLYEKNLASTTSIASVAAKYLINLGQKSQD